jgi:hypothetical protein
MEAVQRVQSHVLSVVQEFRPDVVVSDGSSSTQLVGAVELLRRRGFRVLRWEHISAPVTARGIYALDETGLFFNRDDTDLHVLFRAARARWDRRHADRVEPYLQRMRKNGGTRDAYRNRRRVTLSDEGFSERVFVPGQLPHDSNVVACERRFQTTEDLAIAVALANPDIAVHYKPHPEAGSLDGGEALSRLRNTVIHGRESNVFDLMRQCSATVTLSSNVGLESILHGFRTLCASSTHYNISELCGDLLRGRVADLRDTIRAIKPDEVAIRQYALALLNYLVDLERPASLDYKLRTPLADQSLTDFEARLGLEPGVR